MSVKTWRAAVLALALSTAGVAVAQPEPAPPPASWPPPPRPTVIAQPDWIQRPDGAALGRLYPPRAARRRIPGYARLECVVDATGATTDCQVLAEDPAGEGFGDAALRLSALFRMRPLYRDGVPIGGGKVVIPIRFVLPPPCPLFHRCR